MSLEKYLIEHCAPTLASLKTASMFCVPVTDHQELETQIQIWNKHFHKKGLFIQVLRRRKTNALIYVCRSSHLQSDLQRPGVAEFLTEFGYSGLDAKDSLSRLKSRLEQSDSFPHEIGVFLGYPLDDVIGFIQHGGKNCACTGCWKVYCNPCEAVKTFERYRKCRHIYTRLWNQGRSVLQLTVAA